MMSKLILLLVVLCVQQSYTLKLPSYIKACRRNDPKLDECSRKHGQQALPSMINGDRKYRIPKLNPLTVTEMNIDQRSFKIDFRNMKIYGFDKTILRFVKTDLKNRKIIWGLHFPKMTMLGQYNITGRILILPIYGNGNVNITLDNVDATYTYTFDIIKKDPEKKDYLKPYKGKIDFTTSRLYINFENLFNGDRVLGPQANVILNENWKELVNDLGPPVTGALAQVTHLITSNVCDLVPMDELFLLDNKI